MATPEAVVAAFEKIDRATGQHAYQSLEHFNPEMIEAIEEALAANVTPDEIRKHVLVKSGWAQFANLCHLAAIYAQEQMEGS